MNKDERSSQSVARELLITSSNAARAEQERKILQEELWRQQQDFREVHEQNLSEMKEFYLRYAHQTEVHRGSEHNYGII